MICEIGANGITVQVVGVILDIAVGRVVLVVVMIVVIVVIRVPIIVAVVVRVVVAELALIAVPAASFLKELADWAIVGLCTATIEHACGWSCSARGVGKSAEEALH